MQGQEYAQERGWKYMKAKSGRPWTSMDFVLHTQLGLGAAERRAQLKSANSGGAQQTGKGRRLRQRDQTGKKK